MSNVKSWFVFSTNTAAKNVVKPIELAERVMSSNAKLKKNLKSLLPTPLVLNAIPKAVFNGFLSVRKAINALGGDVSHDLSSPIITCHCSLRKF